MRAETFGYGFFIRFSMYFNKSKMRADTLDKCQRWVFWILIIAKGFMGKGDL